MINEVVCEVIKKHIPKLNTSKVGSLVLNGFGALKLIDTPHLLDSVDEFQQNKLPADTELDNVPVAHPRSIGKRPRSYSISCEVFCVSYYRALLPGSVGYQAQRHKRSDVGVALGMRSSLKRIAFESTLHKKNQASKKRANFVINKYLPKKHQKFRSGLQNFALKSA